MRVVAVDTETEDTQPWSIQWCEDPGKAYMVRVDKNYRGMRYVKGLLEDPDTLVVFHNALFDLRVLLKLGIRPPNYTDTMLMGYVLGFPSLGLKALAYRHCGMELTPYRDVVKSATERKVKRWLHNVANHDWPDPAPTIKVLRDGTYKTTNPRNPTVTLSRWLVKHIDESEGFGEYWAGFKSRNKIIGVTIESTMGVPPYGWLADINPTTARQYACEDADATRRLYDMLWPMVVEGGLEEALTIDMGALPCVIEMEEHGALTDADVLAELEVRFEGIADRLLGDIEDAGGRALNPNSPQQVAEVLYKMGALPNPGMSTDAKTLDMFKFSHEEIGWIQEYRGMKKLVGTYTTPLQRLADANGRVHTTYTVDRTATGRLSSRNPNLQNIPVRSAEGKAVRRAFIAAPGHVLAGFDLSQIELRLIAHESQDNAMLEIFNNGGDIHEKTRSAMFGGPPDDTQRKYAKVVNFSTAYMSSPYGLMKNMRHAGIQEVDEDECGEFISTFFSTYWGYKEWVDRTKAHARRYGEVRDMFGRRRWVPEVFSTLNKIKEEGLRAAVNMPIQGAAAGIMKLGMRDMQVAAEDWRDKGVGVWCILQVHDELILEVEEGVVDKVVPQMLNIFENVISLSVPIRADAEVGDSWGTMKEVG